MLVYIIMTLITCGFAYMASRDTTGVIAISKFKISKSTLYLALAAIPMILVSGLRWETGVDHMNYFYVFTNILYNLNTHVEIGYKLLCEAILLFTEDMSVMFFVCSVITVTLTMISIKRSSSNIFISTFLYIAMGFFFYSMNSIRHFIALAIFMFAFKYLKERKLLKYLIAIVIAAAFHKIALIAIPIYFIFNIKFKAYWYAIFSGALIVVFITHNQILEFVYKFAFGFYKDYNGATIGISYVNIFITLALSIMAFLYRKPLLERNKANIILMNSAYFGLMFFAFCGWIPVYTRIGQYCTILSLFLIPEILGCETRPKIKRLYNIGLIAGFSIFLIIILINAQDPSIGLVPYSSIFSR